MEDMQDAEFGDEDVPANFLLNNARAKGSNRGGLEYLAKITDTWRKLSRGFAGRH